MHVPRLPHPDQSPLQPDRRQFVAGSLAAGATLLLGTPARAEELVAAGVSAQERTRVQGLVAAFLGDFGVPGLSVAYTAQGAATYVAAFGVADTRNGEQMATGHRLRIASIAKPITATAVLLLSDRGQLQLGQRVFGSGGILGVQFPLGAGTPNRAWVEAITVDHLLTHTGGGWLNDGTDSMFRYPGLAHAQLIARTLQDIPLQRAPGTAHAYSSFGYCVLGRVIEAVSGQSYADFVRQAVLAPAGAQGMEIAANTLAERKAGEVVYRGQNGENPYGMDVQRMDAHGGWIGTAYDLVAFANRADGFASFPDLLRPQTQQLMLSATAASPFYGRGWALNPPAHGNAWHAGSLPGTTSVLIRTEGGVNMAGLANSRSPGSDLALDRLMWDIHAEVIG
jgi:CubicO group peptidase (beta-lactamase class C family)